MIYDAATAPHLKPWLVKTLEPICDAEPGALADYILALLKHNIPESEMRKELSSQLEEFLEREGPSFIDTLFTVLRTKSYLPYASASSPSSYPPPSSPRRLDTGIPIPLDGLLSHGLASSSERGQKRNLEHDDRDGRPPTKGPRLSSDSHFSRYPNGRAPGQNNRFNPGGRPERQSMNYAASMEGSQPLNNMNGRWQQSYQPPDQRKGVCRDYYNNGYCARGALCKYSHGEDAVVPSQLFPMNGSPIPGGSMPFMPMFPGVMPFGMGGQGAAYDPHQARMDMRPPPSGHAGRGQRPPLLHMAQKDEMMQDAQTMRASGELPVVQDLTPKPPSEPSSSVDPIQGMNMQNNIPGDATGPAGAQLPLDTMTDVKMSGPDPIPSSSTSSRGGMRGMRGGRGRGTFPSDAQSFRPERRSDKTLVVEKIPEDKLTLENVNNWFKRFGTVTNVAIDSHTAKALVSFSTHDEAHAAWKSEDAVFNNRFVKLFWHRPMEGHGQTGTRMLAASAPVVAHLSTKGQETPAVPPVAASKPLHERKASAPSAATAALVAKQKLLEQQISEQKTLMASLQTASADEKKQIMSRLRQLGDEMKPSSASPSATPVPVPSPPIRPSHERKTSTPLTDEQRRERERLDKELEMHAATAENGSGENTDSLKAELEKLKAEAARLGLPAVASDSSHSSSYRPYRGRARGRGHFHSGNMRGGPPRASMKLDNRPKKLFLSGVGEGDVQAVRDWYQSTGQVESIDTADSGGLVVAFKTRLAAEQGLAKGQDIPSAGRVQVTWHKGQPSTAISKSDSPAPISRGKEQNPTQETSVPSPEASSFTSFPHAQEEEVVASGWGTDGDEDGMGML